MAARTRKVRHDDFTRRKIQTSQLVTRLTNHVLGKVEMTSTQVSAALGLLKKALPDLKSSELTIEDNRADAGTLSRAELEHIAASGRSGVDKARGRKGESGSIH